MAIYRAVPAKWRFVSFPTRLLRCRAIDYGIDEGGTVHGGNGNELGRRRKSADAHGIALSSSDQQWLLIEFRPAFGNAGRRHPHTDRQPSAGDLQAKATPALTQHSDRVTQGRSHQVPTSIQTLYQGFVPKWTSQTNKRNIPSCFQCLERKLAGAAGGPANDPSGRKPLKAADDTTTDRPISYTR